MSLPLGWILRQLSLSESERQVEIVHAQHTYHGQRMRLIVGRIRDTSNSLSLFFVKCFMHENRLGRPLVVICNVPPMGGRIHGSLSCSVFLPRLLISAAPPPSHMVGHHQLRG